MKAIVKYWLPVLFWMGLIFWLSTDSFSATNTGSVIRAIIEFLVPGITPAAEDMIHAGIRKCAHVTEYFILGLLLFRAFHGGSEERRLWRWAGLSLIVMVLYAASDEFHQSFTSSRSASLIDVGIDTIGGLLSQIATISWHSVICRDRNRMAPNQPQGENRMREEE